MSGVEPHVKSVWTAPASRGDLRARVAAIRALLAETLARPLPELAPRLLGVTRLDIVGIGASEGPARMLTSVLVEAGVFARLLPPARFVEQQSGQGAALVVFSQGLSPNARLALRQAALYQSAVLFTSTSGGEADGSAKPALLQTFRASGGVVIEHAPQSEGGSLVRLAGPACAGAIALRFAGMLLAERGNSPPDWLPELARVPALADAAARRPLSPVGCDPAAFIGASGAMPCLPALGWKWQEALYAPLPPVFDVLSFMHGPLQSLHRRPSTLVFFASHQTDAEADLHERFGRVLSRGPHQLVEVHSESRGPLAWFEFDAVMNQLVLSEMDARGIDPACWPAQGHDQPLYQLGE